MAEIFKKGQSELLELLKAFFMEAGAHVVR